MGKFENIVSKKIISKRHYFILYTTIFSVLVFLIFGYFFINGKSFIYQTDGKNQHYTALVYYAKWLRSIFKKLIYEHVFEIPTYSFSIGYGSDIISTLSYYVIGDPLSFFCFLVPTKYIAYYYSSMVIVRFYLSGISFSIYCFNRKENELLDDYGNMGMMAGTFVYIFSGFALYAGVIHPYFINSMIYFPLILSGVERILNARPPFFFIFFVFISAISNFYFFYMTAILTALYTIWRLFVLYSIKELKNIIRILIKVTVYALLGTCMSALIMLPSIFAFINSSRSGTGYLYDALYDISDYENNLGSFLSVNLTTVHDWTVMGYSSVVLISIILLFLRKKYLDVKVAFIVLSLMVSLPAVGSLMNGFSYVSNRWLWGYTFFVAFITVMEWNDLFTLTVKEKCIIFGGLLVYLILCVTLVEARTIGTMFALAIAFAMLWIISINWGQNKCSKVLLFVFVLGNITGNAYFLYSLSNSGRITSSVSYDDILNELMYTEGVAVKKVSKDDDDFFRYSGSSVSRNSTLYSGLHSTQFSWSLENGYISQFRSEMCLSDEISLYGYTTLDSRAFLSALSNVKYYVQDDNVPYGYTFVEDIGNYKDVEDYLVKVLGDDYSYSELTDEEKDFIEGKITTYSVWENELFLPFGYTYDSFISYDSFENLTAIEKQEALMQGCVIESTDTEGEITPIFTSQQIEFEIETSDGVSVNDNSIIVTEENASITLKFEGIINSETYLYICGLNYIGIEPIDQYSELEWNLLSKYEQNEILYSQKYYEEATVLNWTLTAKNESKKSVSKKLTYYTPKYKWYGGREDFVINFGYDENAKVSVTIKFPTIGVYTFDSLEVVCQSMDKYSDYISNLSESVMYNVDFHDDNAAFATNMVDGNIDLDSSKYLLLSIPYSVGWTAYVDGEEQELLRANIMYMALYLEPGEHEITLIYETPGLNAGFIISCISSIILITWIMIYYKKNNCNVELQNDSR